jgi:NAD(P)-dependent dehydrogenase (short-subunit alcohol dehydrogenase family)
MGHPPARIVLVTGASKGVGAQVAQRLAGPDTHVVVNYRKNAHRANALAAAICDTGGHASTLAADISDAAETTAMIRSIAARFGRLDAMILNASSGLELDADPGYATRVNHDAQRRLALLAIPLMPVGGRIVFVTSHQAHFFPNKAVPKGYAGAAASQHAGETALYALRSEFAHAGIKFTVVSGNLADATTLVGPSHRHPSDHFAAAIADSANAPGTPGVVYVGGADHLMPV